MKHQHEEEKKDDSVFYLLAMFTGIFVGFVIDRGFIYIPVGAVLGLLSAAFFLNVLVKGRDNV